MTDGAVDWQAQSTVTTATLAGDLRRLGVAEGGVVLVHSSLSRLGRVEGGADAVIDALLAAVGPRGTVLFPTLTGTEDDGPETPPVIDVRSTPCWTGRIPETARRRAGAIRSLHPTHSIAALGAEAARYAAEHETGQTPCDVRSPYYRLIREGGSILLLGGVTQDSNTSLHCLEELAEVPYHLQPFPTDGVVIDAAGERIVVRNRLHLWGWERDFPRVDAPLAAAGAMRVGRVGASTSTLIAARPFAEVLLPLLREDPLYLLSEEAREAYLAAAG
ncbi:MAG TPA: AAC(3) family N-acetyltransferase [Thermomicrobiales bacterium]|nr:AAC(3) family N-acetyltransferase [Thermomicrobiales bacterium]